MECYRIWFKTRKWTWKVICHFLNPQQPSLGNVNPSLPQYLGTQQPEMAIEITILQKTDYTSRILSNNTVKINPKTPDVYCCLVQNLRSNDIILHTYQIKQDRAYRVVLRHIHYSVPVEDIKTLFNTFVYPCP
ncbi:hypothetical protein M8J75_010538 [Diaphorina citri]|nr:hypothetical protein M8J75_010538 [Diaphorina citri]